PAPAPARPPPSAPSPAGAPVVRVGLLVDTTRVSVSASSGMEVVESGSGRVLGRIAAGEAATVSSPGSTTLVVSAAGREIARSGSGPLLLRAADAAGGEGIISIAGKPYRGDAMVRAAGGGRVTAINLVDMERYLLGVVPREIGRVGPELFEAAKAQAVAARTYAFKYLGRRESLGFDVFATVQDQVYGGAEAEHEPVSRAVRATAGEILTYAGQPIEAYYHSTCAGRTAAIEEVWNQGPVPYLKSVVDVNPATGDAWDVTSSRYRWTQRWTGTELTQILNRTLADSFPAGVRSIGELRDLQVLRRTPSGRIGALRIEGSNAAVTVGGDRVRWILPVSLGGAILNSSKFDVEVLREPGSQRVREVVASGGGWGHGIGMCQVGAMGRARAGQDYRTILSAYYRDTELRDLY
ncbi:MAG: SpoIID/LytB domain-containing protein, partial [Gemmatimonadota bacterium]|nr:SpoIID/LytB domain-containing protein [Gemmatimonadota bacterium]